MKKISISVLLLVTMASIYNYGMDDKQIVLGSTLDEVWPKSTFLGRAIENPQLDDAIINANTNLCEKIFESYKNPLTKDDLELFKKKIKKQYKQKTPPRKQFVLPSWYHPIAVPATFFTAMWIFSCASLGIDLFPESMKSDANKYLFKLIAGSAAISLVSSGVSTYAFLDHYRYEGEHSSYSFRKNFLALSKSLKTKNNL